MIKKTLTTKYGDIVYWVSKIKESPFTLVFLPGLTADHSLFVKQLNFFKNYYNCIVWDPPGHGNSYPFNLDFSLEDQATWLNGILKLENLNNPVLIGQSMGGYISQVFIQKFPKEVSGFISIDSAPLQKNYYTLTELELIKRMEPVYHYFPWSILEIIGPINCAETKFGRMLMRRIIDSYSDKKGYYAQLVGHGYKTLAETIEKELDYTITCPAILICGEKDKAGSVKRYNRNWKKQTNLPLFWIKDAGHNSNTDQPEIVNTIIENFLISLRGNKNV